MRKPVLISGIQPSGKLHLGNYLGALKNFVDLQNSGKYQCYFFVADEHALTANPKPEELRKNIIDLEASFLAAGLNLKKSVLFQQSKIKELQQLNIILSTLAPVSELLRMTAFKEKVLQALKPSDREKITKKKFDEIVEGTNFGLAAYPILMAADILIFNAKFVPVGEDQLQHLELARTLTRKFNAKYGSTLVEPQVLLTKTPRIMSLDDPTKKMSKSRPNGCLFIDDSPEDIKKKVMAAVTDSGSEIKYDPQNKPGVSNLLEIAGGLSGKTPEEIAKKYSGMSYAEFKKSVAEKIADHFADFRKKKIVLLKKPATLKKAFDTGSKKANAVASKKFAEIKKKVGLTF